jgi:hypothetical protein
MLFCPVPHLKIKSNSIALSGFGDQQLFFVISSSGSAAFT